jgi:hypothetical protein
MYENTTRGLETPARQAESAKNNDATCPHCETPILGVNAEGPSEHFLDPCGCRVTSTTARELAGAERGRGVATDGGEYVVSDRDTDEMTLAELREELDELQERVDFWEPYEGQEAAWDRRDEVWAALRERADVEPPKCRKCGGRRWGSAPGDPVECMECGWTASRSVEEDVRDAWDAITEGEDEQQAMTDGGKQQSDTAREALLDEIQTQSDETGALVGSVIESILTETRWGLTDICLSLRQLVVTGDVYQPNDTGLKLVETDGGADLATHEFRVRNDGSSIVYGPWDEDAGEWMLGLSIEGGERVRLLLGEAGMYELWTEIHNTPWRRGTEPRDTLRREIVEKVNGMDEEQLREVLETVDAVGGAER